MLEKIFVGGESPLTVKDWQIASQVGDHLSRLLSHVRNFHEDDPAWISLVPEASIRQQWHYIDEAKNRGCSLPLFGVPYAVKDNIDVAGLPTTAACPDFAYRPKDHAAIVKTLLDAGAIVVGKCNLDAFATGLVGTRSPYGAVPNTFDSQYVSGGSSSGSASVVARGLVPFALGTDTAGSGRVPAGLNNIVGLKATRGALSARGVVPACRTLDCVSIFTLTVEDARSVFDTCAVYDVADAWSRRTQVNSSIPESPLIAVFENPSWFQDILQSNAYRNALEQTETLGWSLQPTDFSILFELASLLYEGPWVAERYAAIREFIAKSVVDIDPIVRSIIEQAKEFNAIDVFASEYLRKDLVRRIEIQFQKYDAILVPTTPTFPTLREVAENPIEENSLLGTYTNFVNFLDWSAISIPAGFRADGLPFGLTIISTQWQEQKLLYFAEQYLSCIGPRRLGATPSHFQEALASCKSIKPDHELVIVGAHLRGFPLNYQLSDVNAKFNRVSRTASAYHLYELPSLTQLKKPGLKRVGITENGSSIDVEIWDISNQGLGEFMKKIPFPLAIGSVQLEDGNWYKGFVCESRGFEGARDITQFGGWKNYINSLTPLATPEASASQFVAPPITINMIKSVLVANRGEIAVRIIKTLKRLRIRAVAIYSAEDKKARHVKDADEAYFLEGETLSETYLSGSAIIQIAKRSDVQAIIPGYGFLSESAEFAQSCEDEGLIWVGPTPQQMRELGLKHLARALAEKAGVPLLSGTEVLEDIETAVSKASTIGYPIIVKSSAGGGGIGLQKCNDEKSLRNAFHSVQHLGKSYFNDSRIFMEKYVQNARHVEIQIIGDGMGTVKHVGERDCSLQRRKQKVIEECPAIFVPESTRVLMREAAIKLTSSVEYRGVGTVEFIYDLDGESFYFLEVNTRLQVEHCVTEASMGLDIVDIMIKIAANNGTEFFDKYEFPVRRISIEARIYGESPLQEFRPCPGQILDVEFPEGVRVDTWIEAGTTVSPSFDPLLAKLIVTGYDRPDAIRRLALALKVTRIIGIETNIEYLQRIVESEMFINGAYTTTTLDTFRAKIPALEILDSGSSTTVQDYPGRIGKWSIGIPPSGPLDSYSFRLANKAIGNDEDAAGLECTSTGPSILFHHNTCIALVGAPSVVLLDGTVIPQGKPVSVIAGQTLQVGTFQSGNRVYISVQGGIQVPKVLGSRSTFALGQTGGHCGRPLRTGDIIPFNFTKEMHAMKGVAPELPIFGTSWTLRVLPGPHGFPDFFSQSKYAELFDKPWKIHYNSNRVGIRLTGPKPTWAREGGEAGLHPSNIHDSPYTIGSISFTGDEAVILTCDGPSLGGFMIFATTISADHWKFGQMRPGDEIKLIPVTLNAAVLAARAVNESIENLTPLHEDLAETAIYCPILFRQGVKKDMISYRQAGDNAILVEFGSESFDIRTSAQICAILRSHENSPISGVVELTPGVRTLHVNYDNSIAQASFLEILQRTFVCLKSDTSIQAFPSRIIHLPLAFEDSSNSKDITRYSQTIRAAAPWLPSNTDFLRRLNGLESKDHVKDSLLSSQFLVLGLGDVFYGSPCAIPLDPRHRLFGMKYNPSRSVTTEGSIGVGGQYLCIYAIDSPGGYQLVGRTVPIWNKFERRGRRWMFNVFDRISFYSITEEELNISRERGDGSELVSIENGIFDIEEYEKWLEGNSDDIERVKKRKLKALEEYGAVLAASKPSEVVRGAEKGDLIDIAEGATILRAGVAGKCWKVLVSNGDFVVKGQILFIIEAMKMEIKISAVSDCTCVEVLASPGDILEADARLAILS